MISRRSVWVSRSRSNSGVGKEAVSISRQAAVKRLRTPNQIPPRATELQCQLRRSVRSSCMAPEEMAGATKGVQPSSRIRRLAVATSSVSSRERPSS